MNTRKAVNNVSVDRGAWPVIDRVVIAMIKIRIVGQSLAQVLPELVELDAVWFRLALWGSVGCAEHYQMYYPSPVHT